MSILRRVSSTDCFEESNVSLFFSKFSISLSTSLFSLLISFIIFSLLLIRVLKDSISCFKASLLYLFDNRYGFISLLNFSLAMASFSSIGNKPIQRDKILPRSVSFIPIRASKFDSVIDIIKSKSDSLPMASLITLLV